MPFLKEGSMYNRNGTPHGDPQEPRLPALSYEGGKINARNIDLAKLVALVKNVLLSVAALTFFVPGLRLPQSTPAITAEAFQTAVANAMTQVLDARDAADAEKMNAKPSPAKSTSKTRARVPPAAKRPEPLINLLRDEYITTRDHEPPIFSLNQMSIPAMRLPR